MNNSTRTRPTLCIAILTYNEEKRIERSVKSAQFADRILVIDSGSTDRTCELAASLGAEVHIYPDWQGFAVQRNRQLAHCTEDFVFFLDADEVICTNLQEEIISVLDLDHQHVGHTYWKEVAFGKPIFCLLAKKNLARLFPRRKLLRFEGIVHEGAILTEPNIRRCAFKAPLLHYSRENIHDSLRKLTQYSMLGAAKRAKQGKRGGVLRGLASAFATFIRLYIFRASFVSGGPGFLYALFISLESFFRYSALHYDRDQLKDSVKR